MNQVVSISTTLIRHLATLAKLVLTEVQVEEFAKQTTAVLDYMSKIQKLNTTGVTETSQVTGLENVFREDKVDERRMLSQSQALSNAPKTHNGYFVVDAVLEE